MPKKDNSPKFKYTLKGWKKYIPFVQTYIDSNIEDINELMKNKSVNEVRQLLYDHIYPSGYFDIKDRLKDELSHKTTDKPSVNQHFYRDDIWATYLNIPKDKRHDNFNKLQISKYRPTLGNNKVTYYSIGNLGTNRKINLINQAVKLPIGKNDLSYMLSPYLGKHTVGHGLDKNNGEYISYYDLWDLNPIDERGGTDASNGIGIPVNIYDRIYLDDFYEIPKNKRYSLEDKHQGIYYGGYLPEVKINSNRK